MFRTPQTLVVGECQVDKKLKKSETVDNAISELRRLLEELQSINLK